MSLESLITAELAEVLKAKKLSQKDAAKEAGLSISAVRNCLGVGRSSPKLETFCKLLTAVKATVSFSSESDL